MTQSEGQTSNIGRMPTSEKLTCCKILVSTLQSSKYTSRRGWSLNSGSARTRNTQDLASRWHILIKKANGTINNERQLTESNGCPQPISWHLSDNTNSHQADVGKQRQKRNWECTYNSLLFSHASVSLTAPTATTAWDYQCIQSAKRKYEETTSMEWRLFVPIQV